LAIEDRFGQRLWGGLRQIMADPTCGDPVRFRRSQPPDELRDRAAAGELSFSCPIALRETFFTGIDRFSTIVGQSVPPGRLVAILRDRLPYLLAL
jgi:hypothetical protein